MFKKLFIVLFISVLFVGCKKHTINKTERNIIKGEWVIRNYTEDGKDLTESGYSEYTFDFNEDGSVVARIQTLSVAVIGSWASFKAEKTAIFELNMNNPLERLTEKWEILDSQKNTVTLSIVSSKGTKKTMVLYQEDDGE
jgi:hypothetical protein